jgi:hypothetical protein
VADIEDFPDYMGDTKRWNETNLEREEALRTFEGANLETDCPRCGWHVWAHIVDGPDPVFIELVCPRDDCKYEWWERT